jgi:hypothetical protein
MPFKNSKRYDIDASEELKYWADNVAPYANPLRGQQIWERQKWADVNIDPNNLPFKHLLKTIFIVKPTHQNHFGRFIARIGEVMAKRMPDAGRLVLRLFSRGQKYVRFLHRV